MSSLAVVSSSPLAVSECCGGVSQVEPKVVAKLFEGAAAVASSILQKAGEEKAPEAVPSVTKELASTAINTAEKTAVVAAATVTAEAPSESVADKLSVSAGIALSGSTRVETKEDKAPSSVTTTEKPSDTPVPPVADAKENTSATPAAVRSKEEQMRVYVDAKKKAVLGEYEEWKKDFCPYPSKGFFLIPGSVGLVRSAAESMTAKFMAKLDKATTIVDLKNVLEKNVEVMTSALWKVNDQTETKLKAAIVQAKTQIESLTPKKSVVNKSK